MWLWLLLMRYSRVSQSYLLDFALPPPQTVSSPTPKAALNIVRSSKVRHVEGRIAHKSTHIEKLPKMNTTVPGDSNAFQVRGEGGRGSHRDRGWGEGSLRDGDGA